jgi:16S rRNA pseudouridine516 synthase
MRIDKYLAHGGYGSRSDVKKMIKKRIVMIDDALCMDPGVEVGDGVVRVGDDIVPYPTTVYLMMHKPVGVLSASFDHRAKTVFDLFDASAMRGLQLVGRLDKDATGLLLLTNDGDLTHQIISPKSNISKHYIVTIDRDLTAQEILILEVGIVMDNKKTLPASIRFIEPKIYKVVLKEGRYHQIKRMMSYVGATVIHLHRTQIGSLILDSQLTAGQLRHCTSQEVDALRASILN